MYSLSLRVGFCFLDKILGHQCKQKQHSLPTVVLQHMYEDRTFCKQSRNIFNLLKYAIPLSILDKLNTLWMHYVLS